MLTLVPACQPILEELKKTFSFDISQIDAASGMVSIDACVPMEILPAILKLLEPYA